MLNLAAIIMISGKGGVGKTSLASALAWLCAKEKKKTLLVSTDPAHNLGDLFGKDLKEQACKINNFLSIEELNPDKELDDYLEQARRTMRPFVSAKGSNMLDSYLDFVRHSPGSQEAAIFHRLAQLIALREKKQWQHIICDTAPSGHTLQLLQLPQQLDSWMHVLQRQQKNRDKLQSLLLDNKEDSSSYHGLEKRHQLYKGFYKTLSEPQECAVILVLEAQRLAIAETQRSIEQLKKQHVQPYALFINRMLPKNEQGNHFYKKRRLLEKNYYQQIIDKFSGYKLWEIPLLDSDITEKNLDSFAELVKEQINKENLHIRSMRFTKREALK